MDEIQESLSETRVKMNALQDSIDGTRVKEVLRLEVEWELLQYRSFTDSSARKKRVRRQTQRKLRKEFTRIAGDKLGYGSGIATWILWMLLSKVVQGIIIEMAKRLYDIMREEEAEKVRCEDVVEMMSLERDRGIIEDARSKVKDTDDE
jgi:hypothetical protein